jgi:mannose-6-phosphate isomerase-like protein (cupin superfamily)
VYELQTGDTAMAKEYPYVTHLDVRFKHLEVIDIPTIVRECKHTWFNQTLTKVNDSVVRVGIVQGEYHWHKHDNDDEYFFVLEGKLFIDLEDRTIELGPDQGVTITKGVVHRTRAPQKTVMLMVESSAIQPTGD